MLDACLGKFQLEGLLNKATNQKYNTLMQTGLLNYLYTVRMLAKNH